MTLTSERDGLSCDEVLRQLDDYMDRALSADQIRRVEAHLADCVACADAARFEAALIDGIRSRLRRIAIPVGLMAAVSARLDIEHADGRLRPPSGGA